MVTVAWFWFVAAALLLVAEMFAVQLFFASLAVAALAAGVSSLLGASLAIQGITFAVFALISLVGIRPIAYRHLKKQGAEFSTNVDALVNATALATTDVDEFGGQVKLSGEIWSANTLGEKISSGEKVVVIAIDGATAQVKKFEEG